MADAGQGQAISGVFSSSATPHKASAKRKKEIAEAVEMILLMVAAAGLIILVAWGTIEYVAFMKA
jgi:hypothetical protein